MEEILKYLPNNIYILITETIKQNPQTKIKENAIEIRLRNNKPIIIKLPNLDIVIKYDVGAKR